MITIEPHNNEFRGESIREIVLAEDINSLLEDLLEGASLFLTRINKIDLIFTKGLRRVKMTDNNLWALPKAKDRLPLIIYPSRLKVKTKPTRLDRQVKSKRTVKRGTRLII